MEMSVMQSAESCYTSTREGKVFGVDGCSCLHSRCENKGKCKVARDWNRTIEMICMNTVVTHIRLRVPLKLRCKEKWWFPMDK